MNAYAQAQRVYAPTTAPTRSDRSVEYDVIARITSRLKIAIVDGTYSQLLATLHENRRLWRTLAIDVADIDNQLPKSLRARVFYLAEYVDHQTNQIIRENSSPMPLFEVNMAILRGLKQTGSAE